MNFLNTPTYDIADTVDSRNYIWDTSALAWVKQTGGGTGPTSNVNVTNFPATYPVTNGSASLSVDDGGGSLTVDGTVAATQSGTWNINSITNPVTISGGGLSGAVSLLAGTALVGGFKLYDSAGTNVATVTGTGAVKVDNSGITQPISGTVTANIGTTNGLALDSTLTGGTAKSILHGTAKGATSANDVTVSAVDSDHNALDVYIRGGGGGSLTSASAVALFDVTGTHYATVTAGGLLKVDGSGVTQLINGSVLSSQIAGTIPSVAILLNAATSAGGGVAMDTTGYSVAVFDIVQLGSGSFSLAFQASPDGGTTWRGITGYPISSFTTPYGDGEDVSTTIAGTWQFNIAGISRIRPFLSSITSGSVSVKGWVSAVGTVNLRQAYPVGAQASIYSQGSLTQGVITTAAPTYITGTINALSLTTSGALRMDGSGVTQPVNNSQVAGNTIAVNNGTTNTGTQRVTISSDSTGQVNLAQGSTALSTTNGIYTNILQGNAVLSNTNPVPVYNTGSTKATFTGMNPEFVIPATPTDMIVLIGSATKTVKITKIRFWANQTTAAVDALFLIKRTSANSGGTTSSVTPVQHDSNSSGVSATMKYYTANASSLGSSGGNFLDTFKFEAPATGSNAAVNFFDLYNCDDGVSGPLTLRGTSESLALNYNGAALPVGLKVQLQITWTEE